MAGSGNSFVDEIYDQFLMCRMCSETYKSPKVLSCMHTFCEKCLEAHYEMEEQDRPYRFLLYTRALTCPMCHSRTELPTGGVHRLPDNFLVANLSDVVDRRKPSLKDPACEICKPGSESETDTDTDKRAVSKCLDCAKLLCAGCADLHRKTRVTESHGLFDFRAEQDIECKHHQNEVLRFYCDPCEECICVLCTFHDHREHDVSSLIDALDRHRGPFEALMNRCRGRIDGLRDQVALIDRCERGLKAAEDHIRDSAIEAIAAVRKREKDLLTELRNTLGERAIEFLGEKNTFKENLKNLEGTFGLTNAMLKGTKIDLLIVKKEMEKKLNAILDVSTTKTPETLKRKEFQFCDENCYDEVIRAAVDRMSSPGRFNGARALESRGDKDPKRAPETKNVATETTPIDDPLPSKPAARREDESVWQRPMAVVTVTETPRAPGTVLLRPVRGGIRIRDSAAQTTHVVLVDGSTDMPLITHLDKETNTASVHVMQKAVSTDNQTMVDKSTTTTTVDVSAAYRGASATAKRPVMVSRGTCTSRTMTMDKATFSLPTATFSRACSPVAWLSNPTASQNVEKSGDGSGGKAGHMTNEYSQANKMTSQPSAAFCPKAVSSPTASKTPAVPGVSGSVKPLEQTTPSPSAPTQVKSCQGQGQSQGQGQGQGSVAERPQNQLQIGPPGTTQTSVPRPQAVPGSQVGHGLIRSSTTVPAPGTQGTQVRSQVPTNVPGSQKTPEAQVGQVRCQAPAIQPASQTMGIAQGPLVPNKGPTTPPGPQTLSGPHGGQIRIPGSAVLPGPHIIPGSPSLPGAQRGPGCVIAPRPQSVFVPASLPGSQPAPGGQTRLQGSANVLRYEATPGGIQTGQAPGVGSLTPGGIQTNLPGPQFVPVTQGSQPPISHYPTSMVRTQVTTPGAQSVQNAVGSSPNGQISTQINETYASKLVQNLPAANQGVINLSASPNPAQTPAKSAQTTTTEPSGSKQVVAIRPQTVNSQGLNGHTNATSLVTVSNPTLAKSSVLPALGQNVPSPANGAITINRNAATNVQTPPLPGAGQPRPSVCPLGPAPPGSLPSAPMMHPLSSAPAQALGGFPGSRAVSKGCPSNASVHHITSQNSVPALSKVNASSSINGQIPSQDGVPTPSNVPFHALNIPSNNTVSNPVNNVSAQRFGGDKVTPPQGAWRSPMVGAVPPAQSPLIPTVGKELGLPQLPGNSATRGYQLYASINANPAGVGGKSFPGGGSLPGNSSFPGNVTPTSPAGSKESTQNAVLTPAMIAKHP